MSTRYMERLAKIEEVLLIANKKINMDELRAGCSYGVPEQLRPLVWRLLFNYLPQERHKWQSHLAEQRANYDLLIEQIIEEPGKATQSMDTSEGDHPLSNNPTSDWQTFFEDNKVLAQIDKDVRRLYPEIQFFQLVSKFPHPHAVKYPLSSRVANAQLKTQDIGTTRDGIVGCVKETNKQEVHDKTPTSEFHWNIVERILFIYAKLNRGVQYVQGMNELVAPIYYIFANDSDDEWAAYAEADTFFCFQQLMSEVKDNFIKKLDSSICGIESSMASFHNQLALFDPDLHRHLITSLEIKPQFYAFRWLSLLLSQEFPLPDVITLWDALLSDPQRFSLLPFVCLAMIELQREQLLCGDFSHCVRLLQNYPDADVAKIVAYAQDIKEGRVQPIDQKDASKGSRIVRHARQLSDTLRNLSINKKSSF